MDPRCDRDTPHPGCPAIRPHLREDRAPDYSAERYAGTTSVGGFEPPRECGQPPRLSLRRRTAYPGSDRTTTTLRAGFRKFGGRLNLREVFHAPVAQLDRASAF